MMESMSEALNVSIAVAWAILALGAFQVGLQGWALIDLARRERVQFEKKWIWALLILVLSSGAIGAIVYLAWGRKVAEQVDIPAVEGKTAVNGGRAERAVATLYGDKDGA